RLSAAPQSRVEWTIDAVAPSDGASTIAAGQAPFEVKAEKRDGVLLISVVGDAAKLELRRVWGSDALALEDRDTGIRWRVALKAHLPCGRKIDTTQFRGETSFDSKANRGARTSKDVPMQRNDDGLVPPPPRKGDEILVPPPPQPERLRPP